MSKSARRVWWIVVLAAVAGGAWWLLRPASVPVETAVVDRGRVQETIDEDGETRVRERFVVSAPVAGRLRRVTLREGDVVEAGQAVAAIEPAPLDTRAREQGLARLNAAVDAERAVRAEYQAADEVLLQADREFNRLLGLAERGLVAAEQKERAELALNRALQERDALSFKVQAAAHDVQEARAAVDEGAAWIEVEAPVSGCVLHRTEESERVIPAGAPVMEIGNLCELEIVVDLLSTDAVRVQAGDTLEVRDWGRDSTLAAIIQRVEPSGFTKTSALGVEEQRVNVVALLSNAPREIGDRFRVGVRVVLWRGDGVLRAPRGAVFQTGGEWGAYVVEAGRARERLVALGHRGDDYVEVLSGLEAGAVVILYPDERVAGGVRVAPGDRR